jgi:hypothetical protein
MGDDVVVVGCVRADSPGMVALGSVVRVCADCGVDVFVAPSGVEVIESRGAVPVCLECLAGRVGRDGSPEFMPISDRQVAEVMATMAHLRRRN